jgi:hypothetical protein
VAQILQRGGDPHDLLHEVPLEKADEERQGNHDEEWQAGNSGSMCNLWHRDVQDRQGVEA